MPPKNEELTQAPASLDCSPIAKLQTQIQIGRRRHSFHPTDQEPYNDPYASGF